MRDNTVMKLNDNIVLARAKKENEIKVLAKYLRRSIENVDDLKQAVNELFKGEAELSLDNDEQFVIYTGQTFDRNYQTRDSVHSISSHEFLNADG
jgi:ABC-type siderophore export system fused ATPase/permease subunit